MSIAWYTLSFNDLYYTSIGTVGNTLVSLQIGYNTSNNIIQSIYPIGPYPPGSTLTPTTNILAAVGQTYNGGRFTTNNVWVYTGGNLPSPITNIQIFSTSGTATTRTFYSNAINNINKQVNVFFAQNTQSTRFDSIGSVNNNDFADNNFSVSSGQICFGYNTKILCINSNNDETYKCVRDLKIGDMVKTYKHGNIPIKNIKKMLIPNDNSTFTSNMYILRKTDDNNLIEDLILSGGHSLLVDHLSEEEEEKHKCAGCNQSIDDKKLMLAGLSDLFEPFLEEKNYLVYHFILENNGDKSKRYGVYANGILVETPNEENF